MTSTLMIYHCDNKRFLQVFVHFIYKEYQIQLQIISDPDKDPRGYALVLPSLYSEAETLIRHELQKYLVHPSNTKYMSASWNVSKIDGSMLNFSWKNGFFMDLKQQARPVTLVLSLVTLLVFILQFLFSIKIELTLFFPETQDQYPQIWRFFSHAFLHFSLLHLLMNLMWMWYLGLQVEKKMGGGKLVIIFLFSSALSGYAQNFTGSHYFGGLSGFVYALTGYCWLMGILRPKKGIYLPTTILIFSILWIMIGYSQLALDNIANTVHFVGLLVGFVIALGDIYLKIDRNK